MGQRGWGLVKRGEIEKEWQGHAEESVEGKDKGASERKIKVRTS